MNGVELTRGRKSPADYNQNLYKVVLTKADMRDDINVSGKDILTSVYLREPVAEVWVLPGYCPSGYLWHSVAFLSAAWYCDASAI